MGTGWVEERGDLTGNSARPFPSTLVPSPAPFWCYPRSPWVGDEGGGRRRKEGPGWSMYSRSKPSGWGAKELRALWLPGGGAGEGGKGLGSPICWPPSGPGPAVGQTSGRAWEVEEGPCRHPAGCPVLGVQEAWRGRGGGGQAPASSFPVRKLRGAWSLEWRPAQGGVRTWAKKGNLALSDSPSRAKKTLQGPRPTLPVG